MLKFLQLAMVILLILANTNTWAARANKAPTVSITSPATGATFAAPATITITANATDSDGSIAKVSFYQGAMLLGTATVAPYTVTWPNVMGGSYSLTAVAEDNLGATKTSTAVAITVTGPRVVTSTPTNGSVAYGSMVGISGLFSGDSSTSVWVNNSNSSKLATLSGNGFYAYVPIFIGTNTLDITVVRTDKTVDKTSLTVVGMDYPKVAFVSPSAATINQPANVVFAVDAVSPGDTISQVNFYNGGTLISTATAPPYQYTWNSIPVGNYSITAEAVDNLGNKASAWTSISVLGPNQPPSASLAATSSGAAPATITLTAKASDTDGTISYVAFYKDEGPVGTTNMPPYSMVLTNVAAGTYSFAAKATDNGGSTTTSAPVSVTVVDQPLVAISNPVSGASYTVPASTNLTATTATTALGVSFYNVTNGTEALIGNSASAASPYTYAWNVRTVGTYSVIAKATFMVSGMPYVISSTPVTITVAPNPTGETITFLHNDFTGNPLAATDINGAIIWKESYRPYGDRLNNQPDASTNRQWFHGKPVDTETGLSYFGARYYDATLGRFMGMDPVGFDEDNIHSFNRYAYGNNNPYKYVDPDGNAAQLILPLIGFGLLANEVATGDVPIVGGGIAKAGVNAGERAAVKAADSLGDVGSATARGRESEKRVLKEMGLDKNTKKVATTEGASIPDALTKNKSIEIKDAACVSCTKQVRIQTKAAKEAGRESVLVTGSKTRISDNAKKAFDKIIERGDLGPK